MFIQHRSFPHSARILQLLQVLFLDAENNNVLATDANRAGAFADSLERVVDLEAG